MVKNAVFVSVALVALAACAGVADLDVKYKDVGTPDAGRPSSSGTLAPGANVITVDGGEQVIVTPVKDAASIVDPETLGQAGGVCPCDETQGLACCSSSNGAVCTTDQTACNTKSGVFLRCFGPDLDGAQCCLRRHATTAESGLAGLCGEGTSIVCTFDSDCPNGKCTIGTCPGGVSVGTCDGTPVCP
jgi:hypothetical protein